MKDKIQKGSLTTDWMDVQRMFITTYEEHESLEEGKD